MSREKSYFRAGCRDYFRGYLIRTGDGHPRSYVLGVAVCHFGILLGVVGAGVALLATGVIH